MALDAAVPAPVAPSVLLGAQLLRPAVVLTLGTTESDITAPVLTHSHRTTCSVIHIRMCKGLQLPPCSCLQNWSGCGSDPPVAAVLQQAGSCNLRLVAAAKHTCKQLMPPIRDGRGLQVALLLCVANT